jgi:DNA-binding NarL/FixJ family response regulator
MPHVWIIEDHAAFRAGIAAALALPPHHHTTRAFETCEAALAELGPVPAPAVILLDVGLPGMDGIEGIAHLKSRAPQASILVLTVFEDDDKIFRAVCAGASGYLLKTQPVASITAAIDEAIAGGSPMNPRVASRVLAMFAKLAPVKKDFGLTAREQDVLRCMAAGLTRKQIPEATKLNPHTADYVMRCIYKKLHVNCATAAVSLAVRERIIDEPGHDP